MKTRVTAVVVGGLLVTLPATAAGAQEGPPPAAAQREAAAGPEAAGPEAAGPEAAARGEASSSGAEPGYCRWVRGEADSRQALLVAPELFARGGLVNAGEAGGGLGTPLGGNTPRLTVGLTYSASRLAQGLALRQRADAECERYQAQAVLQEAAASGRDVGARPGLAARGAFLRRVLPDAQARVEAARAEVQAGRATLEELNALQLKLDALRAQARQTEADLARLQERPLPEGGALPELLQRFSRAQLESERLASRVRQSQAWDVALTAGYDRVFGQDQRVPVLALLTLSYNLGGLWQGAAEARAQEGRAQAATEDVEGVDRRTAQLLADLRATREAERARLEEVGVLLKDLEAQLATLERLQTGEVRRYRDSLWFELARLGAEQAYLEAHVEALGRFMGEPAR
jgi:predicted  nucleic acid-binding Zn-ribbon protein